MIQLDFLNTYDCEFFGLLIMKIFKYHFSRSVGAAVLKAIYGYSVNYTGSEPLVNLACKAAGGFSLAVESGAWAVDSLPFRMALFCNSLRYF